jgi:hypothetical protein
MIAILVLLLAALLITLLGAWPFVLTLALIGVAIGALVGACALIALACITARDLLRSLWRRRHP